MVGAVNEELRRAVYEAVRVGARARQTEVNCPRIHRHRSGDAGDGTAG